MWLRDMADRPNGSMSFDLRTMPAGYRRQFYDGLQRVFSARMADPTIRGKLNESRYLQAFLALLTTLKRSRRRMPRQSAEEYFCPGSLADQPVMLHDLWSCPNCTAILEHHPVTECFRCGWRYPFAIASG
ncbi:MAG: hypothetical protein DWQ37_06890 [Planctomycetota bacterium]|nr:MAG: hypothetical protein DWQ37_06890 [Planctomycetota bacterium]